MLNDEFHKDPQLTTSLDQYEVVMPNQLINFKKSRWQRFIQYLAYPTKAPLEPICTSSVGFTLLK
ncbi:hypothetical protein [Lysinibacillus sphaericus]|uniref:hypothetical protein n=1 Tax=Lysinibacillus sphaericus TaxID=1421 RepID=UPI003D051B25